MPRRKSPAQSRTLARSDRGSLVCSLYSSWVLWSVLVSPGIRPRPAVSPHTGQPNIWASVICRERRIAPIGSISRLVASEYDKSRNPVNPGHPSILLELLHDCAIQLVDSVRHRCIKLQSKPANNCVFRVHGLSVRNPLSGPSVRPLPERGKHRPLYHVCRKKSR